MPTMHHGGTNLRTQGFLWSFKNYVWSVVEDPEDPASSDGAKLLKLSNREFATVGSIPPKAWMNVNPGLQSNNSDCSHYRGIPYCHWVGKSSQESTVQLAGANIAKEHLSEKGRGFRSHRCTIDMLFGLRMFEEKYHEQNQGLCVTYIDLT